MKKNKTVLLTALLVLSQAAALMFHHSLPAPSRVALAAPTVEIAPVVVAPKRDKAPARSVMRAPQGMRDVVWHRAQVARECAIARGQISPLANQAIIDYDLPSSQKRLWIVNHSQHQTLVSDWVAHGSGSGQSRAESFSNEEGSFQTSLGVFRVSETYQGKHGTSLRLDGLERGFNDRARERAIVMHAAWYVDPGVIQDTGRLGRSQGCPAVRTAILEEVQQELANGGMLFAHASQEQWLRQSSYLNCA